MKKIKGLSELTGKIQWIFICLLFFTSCASSVNGQRDEKPKYAPGKEKHRNHTDEIGRKQGKWIFYNTFGEKIAEIDFVNDKKEGIERRFYGYDKVREETEYLGGIKDGQYTRYFFSGQVAQEGMYVNKRKDGKWQRYFEDGTLRQEGSYKMGRKDGVWKTYNRKGNLISSVTYRDGINLADIEAAEKRKEEEKKAVEKKAAEQKKLPTPVKKTTDIPPPKK
ncbi:MAG: toxin-antitoxin system YwqK family antitoxin [Bacteroidia bacterium]|nr:toxin-antitoxin system YwqK family antitoxin [Bacteroidia bacterium]